MAKAMSVEDARGEGPAAGEDAGPGLFVRARAAVSTWIGVGFDAVIGALQRQRAKFAPVPEAAEVPADTQVQPTSKMRRVMRGLAIGTIVLLVGAMTGGWLAFNVFAQKIERQSQLIDDQADETADYRKDADRAERARDDAKAELREVKRELADVTKNYEDAKTRLAEIEGRTLMYGGGAAGASRSARSPYTSPRDSSPRASSGECELSSVQDLSRCLSHGK